MRWLCIALVSCIPSRATIVRELDACAIRVTSVGFDDGAEILRADGCNRSTFYRCSSLPRSAHSCCEPIGVIGRVGTGELCR